MRRVNQSISLLKHHTGVECPLIHLLSLSVGSKWTNVCLQIRIQSSTVCTAAVLLVEQADRFVLPDEVVGRSVTNSISRGNFVRTDAVADRSLQFAGVVAALVDGVTEGDVRLDVLAALVVRNTAHDRVRDAGDDLERSLDFQRTHPVAGRND